MSQFLLAMAETMRWEINPKKLDGFYSNDPDDPGGETYMGIARNRKPGDSWEGWEQIDELRNVGGFPGILKDDGSLDTLAYKFYEKHFWNPLYDRLRSSQLASKLMQLGVNISPAGAVKLLQKSLVRLGQTIPKYSYLRQITVDGVFGEKTLAASNDTPFKQLMEELSVRQAFHYLRWILRKPKSRMKFGLGLLRRAIYE